MLIACCNRVVLRQLCSLVCVSSFSACLLAGSCLRSRLSVPREPFSLLTAIGSGLDELYTMVRGG